MRSGLTPKEPHCQVSDWGHGRQYAAREQCGLDDQDLSASLGMQTRLEYNASVSSDTKSIIGTVTGAVVAMTGVVVSVMAILIGGVNARIDRLETDVLGMDDRLRTVEIALGKVDQRLETLERSILPAALPPADLRRWP
ncbi:MAG: hypothetical protein OXN97_19510 [Bryobacterales bacterium]|nr:hypothetical protein [Bryobacterales bacterium]MDE0628887.1 hypothetical protein [Bryobacterales bacterium]